MGGIIALSMIITVQVSESNPYLWYLDPTVGLCVSLFLLIYGIWWVGVRPFLSDQFFYEISLHCNYASVKYPEKLNFLGYVNPKGDFRVLEC